MKRLIILLMLLALFFAACKKSEEQNVEGKWELENYIVNGIDSASIINKALGAKCNFTFYYYNSSQSYGENVIQWGNDTSNYLLIQGFYETRGNGNNYSISFQDHASIHYAKIYIAIADSGYNGFQILKSEYQALWLSFQVHNTNYELHFSNLSK